MAKKIYPKLKIYTKTGDKGDTSLFGGKRVPKYSLRVETYGTVDELNSFIGLAEAHISQKKIKKELVQIKNDLFEIGCYFASPGSELPIYVTKRTDQIEMLIDSLTEVLPELRNFILSGGGKGASFLHACRTITRRAERRIVQLSQKERVDKDVLKYINRLSDLFFTMARFVNYKEKKKEIIWKRT